MTLMFVVACALSFAVLESAGRIRAVHSASRVAWLVTGSLVIGLSIWAMHFVALLELREPLPLTEDPVTLGVAALTAVVTAAGALNHVNRGLAGVPALIVSGALEGFALVATHYTTIAALHIPATIAYDGAALAWSMVLAFGVSTATLWFAGRTRSVLERLALAGVMGAGLALMHHVAIGAAHFVPDALWREDVRRSSVHALPEAWLAPWIVLATTVVVALVAVAAALDRRREVRRGHAATGDRLTGLANGGMILRELSSLLAHGHRTAVVHVRGDGLSALRHHLGPRAAEQLMVRVGWRLVGAADTHGTAARLGGAEYAVLVHDSRAAERVAGVIRERLGVPVSLDGVLVSLPVTVVVAHARPGDTAREVLARASGAADRMPRTRSPLAPVADLAGA